MAFHVYAHDCGCLDFVNSFDTRAEAQAYANQLHADVEANPTQWDLVHPWFEITDQVLHARETYTFPNMSEMG